MKHRRRIATVTVAMGVFAGTAAASPTEAAVPQCAYPYVCLSNPDTGSLYGRYKDVTSGYQSFPARVSLVQNTRNDDVVYLRKASNHEGWVCFPPNFTEVTPWPVDGIRISSSSTC